MAAEGTTVDPSEVIVTTGGQQVIDLVCKTLIDPGDVIVAEAPTYPGAVPTFSAYQADVEQIDIDGDGMPIDALESTLDRLAAEGRRPKFIYTIPNFQNPGGVTMSLPRRRRLIEVARERELLILEDNPYGLLRYEGEPLPTLYSLDAEAAGRGGASDLVIYLGTFSKILAPGLRLGWAVAPRPVLEKLNLGKQGSDLCSSPVTQMFVAAYFEHGDEHGMGWQGYVERLRDLYRTRRDVMLEALEEHFGEGASWTRPEGGLFIWATLDERIDTTDLLALARTSKGVAFVPGPGGLHGRAARLILDAPELRRHPRGADPRGDPPHRRRDRRAARPAGLAERLVPGGRSRAGATGRRADRRGTDGRRRRAAPPRERLGGAPPPGPMSESLRVAVLQGGRSLERAVSLRSGAQVRDGLARLGHTPIAIDTDSRLVEELIAARAGRRIRRPARPRRGGRDDPGGARSTGDPLHGLGSGRLCARDRQDPGQAPDAGRRRSRRPPSSLCTRPSSRSSAERGALPSIEAELGFPMVVKPARGGSALGVKFARRGLGAARSDGRGLLL